MIGVHHTTDDNGHGLRVRFGRVDGRRFILQVSDLRGADRWSELTQKEIKRIRAELP